MRQRPWCVRHIVRVMGSTFWSCGVWVYADRLIVSRDTRKSGASLKIYSLPDLQHATLQHSLPTWTRRQLRHHSSTYCVVGRQELVASVLKACDPAGKQP